MDGDDDKSWFSCTGLNVSGDSGSGSQREVQGLLRDLGGTEKMLLKLFKQFQFDFGPSYI